MPGFAEFLTVSWFNGLNTSTHQPHSLPSNTTPSLPSYQLSTYQHPSHINCQLHSPAVNLSASFTHQLPTSQPSRQPISPINSSAFMPALTDCRCMVWASRACADKYYQSIDQDFHTHFTMILPPFIVLVVTSLRYNWPTSLVTSLYTYTTTSSCLLSLCYATTVQE